MYMTGTIYTQHYNIMWTCCLLTLVISEIIWAHGQIGSLGSSLSPKSVIWVWPSMLKQSEYLLPAVSALQLQCQLSTSEDSMSKPPEVVPNMVLAAKQTQVLNMAQELEAWNLHALHASSLEL